MRERSAAYARAQRRRDETPAATPRRVGGALRRLTDADRARRDARNERRDRVPRLPVAPGEPLRAIPRTRLDRDAFAAAAVDRRNPIRLALAFIGRKRKGPKRG